MYNYGLGVIILTNLYRRGKIKDGDIMNILKHISIKGEIFCEYAFLNFDFEFEHDMLDRISTEYIFRLPSGALISSVKVLSGTEFVPAKSTTVSHASKVIDLGMPAAQLRRVDNNLYSMNLSGISKGSCHILITAYAELKDNSGKKRLNIPLCDNVYFFPSADSFEKNERKQTIRIFIIPLKRSEMQCYGQQKINFLRGEI